MKDKLNFLAGQHHALLAAVYALIVTHPDTKYFKEELEAAMERALSSTVPTAVPEQYMQGFQAEKDELIGMAWAATRIVRLSKYPLG